MEIVSHTLKKLFLYLSLLEVIYRNYSITQLIQYKFFYSLITKVNQTSEKNRRKLSAIFSQIY